MKKILLFLSSLFLFANLSAQTIAEIQGNGDESPYVDQTVTTTGIVTAVHTDGYFIQDGTALRSGIYIYDQTYFPAVGDEVTVTGGVVEFFNLTEISNLTDFSVNSSNNALPAPLALTTAAVNNEDYEGMLVSVNGTCTDANLGFEEFELNDGSGATRVDDQLFLYTATENIDYAITGILNYTFDNYKVLPRSADDVVIDLPLYFTVAPKETALTTNSLTIEWETNVPANTIIEYGLTPNFEIGTLSMPDLSTTHQIILENLDPGTIYYARSYSQANGEETPNHNLVMATVSNSSGAIKVYFNHEVNTSVATISEATSTASIVDTIIAYLDLAQTTLDFTMYEAQNAEIIAAINAADERGVAVRIISDDMGDNEIFNTLNADITVVEGNADGIMHDKFILIDAQDVDQAWVMTGSMNHTVNNLGWDYNNIICIQDQSLAKGYLLEFEEMWEGDFGSDKTDNTPHHFRINNIPVELYFSPTDGTTKRITEAIDAAESELAFAILVFTDNGLGTAVRDAHDRGLEVKGIIDYVEFNGSEYDFLLDNDVNVQDYQNEDGSQWPDGPTLHHKYAVIDYAAGSANPLVITGSHNWTASAGSVHDENTLLIYDAEIANWYYQEFYARFFDLLNDVENINALPLAINPNPFRDILQVNLPESGTLTLYGQLGHALQAQQGVTGINELRWDGLSTGIYFLQFTGKSGTRLAKIVKE